MLPGDRPFGTVPQDKGKRPVSGYMDGFDLRFESLRAVFGEPQPLGAFCLEDVLGDPSRRALILSPVDVGHAGPRYLGVFRSGTVNAPTESCPTAVAANDSAKLAGHARDRAVHLRRPTCPLGLYRVEGVFIDDCLVRALDIIFWQLAAVRPPHLPQRMTPLNSLNTRGAGRFTFAARRARSA